MTPTELDAARALATDLLHATLHGPPPVATTMALAEAVVRMGKDLDAYTTLERNLTAAGWRYDGHDIPTRAMWDELNARLDLVAMALGMDPVTADEGVVDAVKAVVTERDNLRGKLDRAQSVVGELRTSSYKVDQLSPETSAAFKVAANLVESALLTADKAAGGGE